MFEKPWPFLAAWNKVVHLKAKYNDFRPSQKRKNLEIKKLYRSLQKMKT